MAAPTLLNGTLFVGGAVELFRRLMRRVAAFIGCMG
jgi:hypothetical protein